MSEAITVKKLAAEIADRLLKNNRFATLGDTGEILRYEEGIYTEGGESFIVSTIQRDVDKEEVTNHLCLEVLGHVRRSTQTSRKAFDSATRIVNLKNGLLDLDTFALRPHTPDYLSVIQLPVKFDALARCPRFLQFLKEVQYAEDLDVSQEWFGFCLSPGYKSKKALMLVGGGDNGKSVFLSVLGAFLGVENVAARSLWALENNRFALADLYGKMSNAFADLPDMALEHTGVFKMITGGDLISAERKHQHPFTFVNRAKVGFSTNKIPEAKDDSDAFFSRWILLTFPNAFTGNNVDRNLLEKLVTEEELSGILNWAIAGLRRLQANGWEFTNSKSAETLREEYKRKSSPVWAFLEDCTLVDVDGYEVKKELYSRFCEYCRERKLPIPVDTTFFGKVPQYRVVSDYRPEVDGKRLYTFKGLRLRPKKEWGQKALDDEGKELNQ